MGYIGRVVADSYRVAACAGVGVAEEGGRMKGGWISVKDKMPEDGECATVCDAATGNVHWGQFRGGQWDFLGLPLLSVTHWMPLPDSPEPAKSDLQRVCEWLGIESPRIYNWHWRDEEGMPDVTRESLLWRIEEALIDRGPSLRWVRRGRIDVNYGDCSGMPFSQATRAEALLKAALWVMKKEEA